MATRNFWLEANIDGRKTPMAGGPQAKDGGFDLTIYIRDGGCIHPIQTEIRGRCLKDGSLEVRAINEKGEELLLSTGSR